MDRADPIARLVAEKMTGFQPRGNVNLEQLRVSPVQLDRNLTNEQIAGQVSTAIERSLAQQLE